MTKDKTRERLNKKILLLGGSRQQVPVIQRARELGLYTILIDYLPDNPGRLVADKWYSESTTDVEKVYEIALKENVDGILAYASDPAALPAAIVAERLNLPTNPSKAVEILGVKHKFRQFLKENGFPSPSGCTFFPDDNRDSIVRKVSELKFPIIVKPTDSSGSKGVSIIHDTENIEKVVKNAAQYSRNKILIAEEYIERGFPNVIGGDIFVENGKITLFGDMSCQRGDKGKSLIPIGKVYPDGLTETQKKNLYDTLQKVIETIGIKDGQLNIEAIIDKEDQPHLLEIGPRAGGNMIPIQLSDIFKVDLIDANVKVAMGLPVDLKPEKPSGYYMTYVLHSLKDGKFDRVEFTDDIEPFVYRKVIYKEKGDRIERFDGAGKAIGIVFLKFDSLEQMESVKNSISDFIKVEVV